MKMSGLSQLTKTNNSSHYLFYEVEEIFLLTGDIDKYTLPVILFLGLPANLVAAMIFLTKDFRKTSFGLNLLGKSVSDFLFLMCTGVVWLETIEVNFLHTSGVCQLVIYLTYVSAFTSVWSVVALALENLVRIRYPFKVVDLCRAEKARKIIAVTVTLSCLVYLPILWVNRAAEVDGHSVCHMNSDMRLLSSVYTYLDTIITLVVPCFLIITFLIMTIESLLIAKARSVRMFQDLRTSLSVLLQQQVIRMLSTVSVTFILLTFPSHLTRIILLILVINQGATDISGEQYLAQHLIQLLYYFSFAINLLTYVIFCRNVRRKILQGLRCMCYQGSSDSIGDIRNIPLSLTDVIASKNSETYSNKQIRLMLQVRINKIPNSTETSLVRDTSPNTESCLAQ